MHSDRPAILFQTTQGGAFAVPQEISVLIGHLTRDADLVAVEVMGLLAVFAVFVDVVLIGETTYVRAYCTHPTSGLKILCGLRFAIAYL